MKQKAATETEEVSLLKVVAALKASNQLISTFNETVSTNTAILVKLKEMIEDQNRRIGNLEQRLTNIDDRTTSLIRI
jgi:hypothetical protein